MAELQKITEKYTQEINSYLENKLKALQTELEETKKKLAVKDEIISQNWNMLEDKYKKLSGRHEFFMETKNQQLAKADKLAEGLFVRNSTLEEEAKEKDEELWQACEDVKDLAIENNKLEKKLAKEKAKNKDLKKQNEELEDELDEYEQAEEYAVTGKKYGDYMKKNDLQPDIKVKGNKQHKKYTKNVFAELSETSDWETDPDETDRIDALVTAEDLQLSFEVDVYDDNDYYNNC